MGTDFEDFGGSPDSWKVADVIDWARQTSLPVDVLSALQCNEIDGPILLTLSESDLSKELNIQSLGTRRYLWHGIEKLKNQSYFSNHGQAVAVCKKEVSCLLNNEKNRQQLDFCVVRILTEELEKQDQIIKDNRVARQLDCHNPVPSPEDVELAISLGRKFEKMRLQEEYDHQFASSLNVNGRRSMAIASSRRNLINDAESEMVKSLTGMCIGACVKNKINVAEALENESVTMPSHCGTDDSSCLKEIEEGQGSGNIVQTLAKLPPVSCKVCFEDGKQGFELLCKHDHCKSCMTKLLQNAIDDRGLLPLKCCGNPIDIEVARWCLPQDQAEVLIDRQIEIQTENKMFCPMCNVFINLDLVDNSISSQLRCKCNNILCTKCRTTYHWGLSCDQNLDVQKNQDIEFLALVKTNQWQLCPNCSITVELTTGCNHITCTSCNTGFCYQCGSLWDGGSGKCSSGDCNVWEEDNLRAAGEQRVAGMERNLGHVIEPLERRRAVHREMRRLNANETCPHEWVKDDCVSGSCARCSFELNCYGMRCEGECGSIVCYTCAHHRLPAYGWG